MKANLLILKLSVILWLISFTIYAQIENKTNNKC
jgi:hypothetical protein